MKVETEADPPPLNCFIRPPQFLTASVGYAARFRRRAVREIRAFHRHRPRNGCALQKFAGPRRIPLSLPQAPWRRCVPAGFFPAHSRPFPRRRRPPRFRAHFRGQPLLALRETGDARKDAIALAVDRGERADKDAGQPLILVGPSLFDEIVEQGVDIVQGRAARGELFRQRRRLAVLLPVAGLGDVGTRPDRGGADRRRSPLRAGPGSVGRRIVGGERRGGGLIGRRIGFAPWAASWGAVCARAAAARPA